METITSVIPVPSFPNTKAWSVLYKNGQTVTEGEKHLWPSVDHGNIKAMMALGIQLPQGTNYKFTRHGFAALGQPASCSGATVSVDVGEIRLAFEFKVTK